MLANRFWGRASRQAGVKMIRDEDLEGLPKEPRRAFVALVEVLWDRVQINMENSQYVTPHQMEFISDVLGAAKALNIVEILHWELPDPDDDNLSYYFRRFSMAALHFVTEARLRNRMEDEPYSVGLDDANKRKIRHFIEQIKEAIGEAGLPPDKHDTLMTKLNNFATEVDKVRTGMQQFAAVYLAVCSTIGDGFDKLEPARRWVDSAANLLGKLKGIEEIAVPKLSQQAKPKRIEGPPAETFRQDLDDEIPF